MWYLFVLISVPILQFCWSCSRTVALRNTLLVLPDSLLCYCSKHSIWPFFKPNPVRHAPLLFRSATFLMLPDKLLCYRNKHAICPFARVQATGGYTPVLDPVPTVNLNQLQIMDSTGALRPPTSVDHYPDFAVNLSVDMMHAGAIWRPPVLDPGRRSVGEPAESHAQQTSTSVCLAIAPILL